MSRRPQLRPEELLAQVGWVRSLALQMVRDPHAADDLAQDALLVALSHTAHRPRSLRGWLASVMRNLSRTSRRSEDRRARRQARAVSDDEGPSTVELVERAATQRALVGALLELEEPYRATLLQRFFEERTAREIARREDLPESTVATRTREGLRRLRAKLGDKGSKGSGDWLAVLMPLLRWPTPEVLPVPQGASSTATATKGVLPMHLPAKLFLTAGALAALVFTLVTREDGGPARGAEPVVDAQQERRAGSTALADVAADDPLGRIVSSADHTPVVEEETELPPVDAFECTRPAGPLSEPVRVHGRVIDVEGKPMPGLEVCVARVLPPLKVQVEPEPSELADCVTSDGAGEFELEGYIPFYVRVRSQTHVTLFQGSALPFAPDAELTVVVGWRIPLAGVVVDEEGQPIAGASVTQHMPARPLNMPGDVMAAATPVHPTVHADAAGRFSFEEAGGIEGALLVVEAPGFLASRTELSSEGHPTLRIVLKRAQTDDNSLTGRVLFADGRPAPGALVSLGWATARADDAGRFALELEHAAHHLGPDDPVELTAAHRDALPARMSLPTIAQAQVEGWPEDLELHLGGPPLTLSGIVVDQEGEPLRGVRVDLLDGVDFGLVMEPGRGWGMRRTLEQVSGGGETYTDKQGRFTLQGLRERDYRIDVMEPFTLLSMTSEPYPAGREGIELVLDKSRLGTLRGRVVDRDGIGVGGVRLSVSRRKQSGFAIGNRTTSDAEGYFKLEGVATMPEILRLEGAPIVPDIFYAPDPEADPQALVVEVQRRCQLQVAWGDWQGRADVLRVVDADGVQVQLLNLERGSIGIRQELGVDVGFSPVLAVGDHARHALLMKDEVELARFELRLEAGELFLLEL